MRIDKFLWFARLTKTRAAAAALAEGGHIRVSGRRIDRAHARVAVGDVMTLMLHDQVHVLRIEAMPRRRGPSAEARGHYTDMAVDGAPAQT